MLSDHSQLVEVITIEGMHYVSSDESQTNLMEILQATARWYLLMTAKPNWTT